MSTTRTRVMNKYDFRKEVVIFETEVLDAVGRQAIAYLERWGMVAAMPDGEDSSGRQRLRLSTTAEVVTRAFDVAEEAMRVARERGHVVSVPDLNEINAEDDARHAAKLEAERAASNS